MKNYKFLVPLLLIALFVGSFYMLFDAKSTELKQYHEYLATARDYRKQDIQVDAEVYYKQALSIKPSLELYIEIGEFYKESQQTKKAINWGDTVIREFPKESKGYEFLLEMYIDKRDYVSCFNLAEKFEKRELSSNTFTEKVKEIEYTYFFNGEYNDVGVYGGGYSPIKIEEKWGYVNLTGDEVVACKFTKVGPFSGDLAPVVDEDGNAYFIDPNGNKKRVVLDVKDVKELGLIENGIFSLFNGKTWSFYNDKNELLFGEYDNASSIGNGIAAVEIDGTWSIINREGKKTTEKTYSSVLMDEKKVVYRNERLFVYSDEGYDLIDTSGKVYGNQKYADAHLFNDSTYAAVKIGDKWGFIDRDGNIKIEAQFENARSFSNGFAAIKMSGKWGFIDMDGKVVIEPEFDEAKDFNVNGCVFVNVNSNWKLLRLYKFNH